MQYRRFYQKTLGIKLDPSFDVHHINGDRSDNEIFNLVAIPKSIHKEYHKLRASKPCQSFDTEDMPYPDGRIAYDFNYLIKLIQAYSLICYEIDMLILQRDEILIERYGLDDFSTKYSEYKDSKYKLLIKKLKNNEETITN